MLKNYKEVIRQTCITWLKHNPFQQSAVIAYYTLFSLPSFMVIVIAIGGYFYDRTQVKEELIWRLGQFIGEDTASGVNQIVSNISLQQDSTLALIIGVGVLLFGATGAFIQLKKAMNRIWGIREKKSNFVMLLIDRGFSLGMVLIIGILLLLSVALTAVITSLGSYIADFAPQFSLHAIRLLNFAISLLLTSVLFSVVFKVLPDIKVGWKVTFVGGLVTAALFLLAVYGISLYFSITNPTSIFGGASSILLLMVWIYYAGLVVFFGAEFTVQYARYKGEKVEPNRFGEPAFVQAIRDLKAQKNQLQEQREILKELAQNIPDKS